MHKKCDPVVNRYDEELANVSRQLKDFDSRLTAMVEIPTWALPLRNAIASLAVVVDALKKRADNEHLAHIVFGSK